MNFKKSRSLLCIGIVLGVLLATVGCEDNKKDLYLPEANNDQIYTTVGGDKQEDKKQTEFCLISTDTAIELNSDIEKVNLKPLSVEHGSGDGFKWTENKYADVVIKVLYSDDGKGFINRITTTSPNYETARGLKVGDGVSKLTDTYDDLKYSETIEESYYVYDPETDIGFKRIFFYVENDSVREIVVEDGIDG